LGKLSLLIPVRAVCSTDFGNFHHRGFTTTPALYSRWRIGPTGDYFWVAQLTANFGNRQINAYFYDVAPAYARPDRPAYDAHGGYLGSDFFTGFLVPLGQRWRLFGGVQTLVHSGSANEGSPLFRHHFNYSVATGLIWTIYRSRKPAVPAGI
jgi:hypothetical protein